MLERVKAPDKAGREAMYYPQRQDEAYQRGAYNYIKSIAMAPRIATIAAYIRGFALRSVLDVGCGPAQLLDYLDPDVGYVGVDIAPTAVAEARSRFGTRASTEFHVADFRDWSPGAVTVDGVVWAGIGCAWTRRGRGGSAKDWQEILDLAERPLKPDGILIFELVTPHWSSLEGLVDSRYEYLTGCDLDCFHSEESPRRSLRVFRRKRTETVGARSGRLDPLVPMSAAAPLIALAERMGQATDAASGNLGFGYFYYGLARLMRPKAIVCIGSYRGFAPVALARGLADNGGGTCYFIDPGLVDDHWHNESKVRRFAEEHGVGPHFVHLRETSQQAIARGRIPQSIDLLLVDGDHSFEGVRFDFENVGSLVRPGGFILLHDSVVEGKGYTRWEVKRFLAEVVSRRRDLETLTLPFGAGLTLLRKRG